MVVFVYSWHMFARFGACLTAPASPLYQIGLRNAWNIFIGIFLVLFYKSINIRDAWQTAK